MLADQATAENGKLFILGGGWDRLSGGGPFEFTVAALAEVASSSGSVDVSGQLQIMNPNGDIVVDAEGKPISIPVKIQGSSPQDSNSSGWIQFPLVFRFVNLALAHGNYSIGLALNDYATSKSFVVVA